MLQPHRVADLVHHGGEAPRAPVGEIVIGLAGAAEPDVARDAARVGREAAISGRGVLVGGLRDSDIGVNRVRFRDLGERQAGRRRDLGEGCARRRLLLGAQVHMVGVDPVAVQAGAVVIRARRREAVGQVQRAPFGADQGRIDVAVARKEVASVRIGAERQKLADISACRVGRGRVEARAAAFLVGVLVMLVRDRQSRDRFPCAKTRQAVARVAGGRAVTGGRVAGGSGIVGRRRGDADLGPGIIHAGRRRGDADLDPGVARAVGGKTRLRHCRSSRRYPWTPWTYQFLLTAGLAASKTGKLENG